MKLLKNRWLMLILGLLVGGYVGGELALRYSASNKVDYDQALENHYIDSRIWKLATSIVTLAKAEKGRIDGIIGDHQLMLRGAFLALVDLHKTGHYKRKDEEIRKHLTEAKAFMAERPEEFLNQKFFAASYIADHGDNPKMSDDPESGKVTNLERKQLQDAFDYIDDLLPASENGDREQGGAGKTPTPLESK